MTIPIVFLWGPIKVGGVTLPLSLRGPLLYLAHKFYLGPLLTQDRAALEEEQARYPLHHDKHVVELNPLVSAFMKVHPLCFDHNTCDIYDIQMTVEKWEQYLEGQLARKASISPEEWRLTKPAGMEDL